MNADEKKERNARLKNIVDSLPDKPGSYQYYDKDSTIIYVGKAKSLKKRVRSYFLKEVNSFKTRVLVSKIWNITYTVVNSEEDALLLENSLIKKYNPRYNILLKDGKTYPSICVTKEYLPRIIKTRNIKKGTGTYFGPYSHLGTMYAILDFIKKLYKPRRCNTPMTAEGILEGKYKACLEYHLHNCKAPCIANQTQQEYMEYIEMAKEVLKGNTRSLAKKIYADMMEKAAEMKFEEAADLKETYLLLENYCSKSEVVSHTISNVDVFNILADENEKNVYVNFLHVTNGTINQSFTFEYQRKLQETAEEMLPEAITEIRERFHSDAKEIIVPFIPDWNIANAEFFVPQRGDKKTLLELSLMNCRQYRVDRLKQAEKLNPEQKTTRLLKELQTKLQLPHLPYTIECFDNSNISGTNAVAGCVVFKGLKPSKKDYRKYNIKTVEGPDDYGSMKEVVRRRYSRMMEEGSPLPDLIITDGGKGQMGVVSEVVKDELRLDIPIAGLAKNDRHRTNELLFGDPIQVVALKTDSELFHALTRIQDEVHRYAISFHRDKRSKAALHSELDDIPGIGPKTRDLLLKHLKSVKKIREADHETLASLIGEAKALKIKEHFKEV